MRDVLQIIYISDRFNGRFCQHRLNSTLSRLISFVSSYNYTSVERTKSKSKTKTVGSFFFFCFVLRCFRVRLGVVHWLCLCFRDENRWDVTERALSAQVGRLNPRLSTEYTDTWRGSRGRVRCIWIGSANLIIYSSLFDLPIVRYFRATRHRRLHPRNLTPDEAPLPVSRFSIVKIYIFAIHNESPTIGFQSSAIIIFTNVVLIDMKYEMRQINLRLWEEWENHENI